MNVVLQLTEACNLKCTYCYYPEKRPLEMTAEVMEGALDYFAALGKSYKHRNLNITFFGGEPLLKGDLIQRGTRFAREKYGSEFNVNLAVNTNGTLITPEWAEFFKSNDFRVFFSMDGVEDSHNTHRCFHNGKGSFDQLSQALEWLERKKLTVIRVITPETMSTLRDDMRMFLKFGIMTQVFAISWDSGWTPELFQQLEEYYRELADEYLSEINKGTPVYVSLFGDKIKLHLTGRNCKESSCSIGQSVFAVNGRGEFFPCTRFLSSAENPPFLLGDLTNGFRLDAMERIKEYHRADLEFCKECTLKDRCLGNGCGCTAFTTTGRLGGDPSAMVCTHERMLCAVADEVGEVLFKYQKAAPPMPQAELGAGIL